MTATKLAARVIAAGGLRVSPDDEMLLAVCSATIAYVTGLPVIADRTDQAAAWSAPVELGTVMLAARWYRRKDTPSGIVALDGDGGSTVYVTRHDADISRLLSIDEVTVG